MRAVMFAAGRGERLKPFTDTIAKPALPVFNIPMMGFPLFYLERAGLSELVVNTHHLPSTVESATRALAKADLKLHFSHEPGQVLGSGGGLAQAWRLCPGQSELFVVNADAVAIFADANVLQRLLALHRRQRALATLLVVPFPKVQEAMGGVYVDQDSRVRTFSKKRISDPEIAAWHFSGYMVVRDDFCSNLSTAPSNILYDILLPKMNSGDRVVALCENFVSWFETGNLTDYLSAHEQMFGILAGSTQQTQTFSAILNRFSPEWPKGYRAASPGGGAELIACARPKTLNVRGFAVAGQTESLAEDTKLERVVLAGGARVQPGQSLHDQLILRT